MIVQLFLKLNLYQLRSVVLAEVNNTTVEKNIVIGSSAMIMIHPNNNTLFNEEYFIYDPIKVADKLLSSTGSSYGYRTPVRQIARNHIDTDSMSFEDMANKRGIIFMYQLVTDDSKGDLSL